MIGTANEQTCPTTEGLHPVAAVFRNRWMFVHRSGREEQLWVLARVTGNQLGSLSFDPESPAKGDRYEPFALAWSIFRLGIRSTWARAIPVRASS